MAENILNLEHLHELVEQELDNAIKFIERKKKKRVKNEKIRKKLEKQANEIGMTRSRENLCRLQLPRNSPVNHPAKKNLMSTRTLRAKSTATRWMQLLSGQRSQGGNQIGLPSFSERGISWKTCGCKVLLLLYNPHFLWGTMGIENAVFSF
jgi:hypothetical protein